jgi:hypothetical protein
MEKVYLIKKGGNVIAHRDLAAMKQLDGIAKPDKTITVAEWEAAGSIARIIGGEIVLGKTAEEKKAEGNQARIAEIKGLLSGTDYIAAKIAEGAATKADYAQEITRRAAWRMEIATLEGEISQALAS